MRPLALVLMCLTWGVLAGCDRGRPGDEPAWRTDCPPRARPAPLSLDAAREAQRAAEVRHELRLREAVSPGSVLRAESAALDPAQLAAGRICLAEVDERGERIFEHEYGFADGLGGGAAAQSPRGPFRRVHGGRFGGPETISCPSCHWVGGPNGAGAETDDAFLEGDADRPRSADARNPPALLGLGVVQALAHEMTETLAGQRAELLRAAANGGAREIALRAKGVDFGTLRLTSDGALDTAAVAGVDPDLVVKPFGWKGTQPDFASFSAEALQIHLGIQSDALLEHGAPELLGAGKDPADPDDDGVRGELGRGPFTALAVHLALLELPIIEPLIEDRLLAPSAQGMLAPTATSFADDFQRGREEFHALGCARCHVPMLVLEKPVVRVDGAPAIDLAREMRSPGLTYDPAAGGYPVWLFSDLKRHDMGARNAATHLQGGVPREQYLTPRLWGVADSAPYLHDGRAPSLDYAIAGHDGEGAAARAAYAALGPEEKGDLRVYLMSLRRAPRVVVP